MNCNSFSWKIQGSIDNGKNRYKVKEGNKNDCVTVCRAL